MLAIPGPLPVADEAGQMWAYEVKWDGMRIIATSRAGRVRLASRSGSDVTASFPEAVHDLEQAAAARALPDASVLDGEMVAFDESGLPSFARLAPRLHRRGSPRPGHDAAAVTFVAFDVLRLTGRDVVAETYDARRALLAALDLDGLAHVQRPDSFADGGALLTSTADRGLEGVVAKRRASPYRPGVRSPDWVKVPHRRTRSYVVGGWKRGDGQPLGSMLVGTPVGGGALQYDGAVGSGLSGPQSEALLEVMAGTVVAESPFDPAPGLLPDPERDGVTWVDPMLVVDVAHLGRSGHGLLRQPSVVRLRPDLGYADVARQDGVPHDLAAGSDDDGGAP